MVLHDHVFYNEIVHQKPIPNKIKFKRTESNFNSVDTLRMKISYLKKEIEHLKVIRNTTLDQSTEVFLPLNLLFS